MGLICNFSKSPAKNPFGFISLKKALAKASAFFLAEDKGVEPSRRVSDLLP